MKRLRAFGVVLMVAALLAACGGGSSSHPSERELLSEAETKLSKIGVQRESISYGTFIIPAGSCTISVVAIGAEASEYEGYPWTVESPDGEVAVKVGPNGGAVSEECKEYVSRAMGW